MCFHALPSSLNGLMLRKHEFLANVKQQQKFSGENPLIGFRTLNHWVNVE